MLTLNELTLIAGFVNRAVANGTIRSVDEAGTVYAIATLVQREMNEQTKIDAMVARAEKANSAEMQERVKVLEKQNQSFRDIAREQVADSPQKHWPKLTQNLDGIPGSDVNPEQWSASEKDTDGLGTG